MAEQGGQQQPDKYIKCSTCKCKYINDNAHILNDFGYNRLDERYKTCVKCRARNKVYGDLHYESIFEKRHIYNNKNR